MFRLHKDVVSRYTGKYMNFTYLEIVVTLHPGLYVLSRSCGA